MIDYDPSPDALFNPWRRETLFRQDQSLNRTQIAVESARLAYTPAETSAAMEQRLVLAMGLIGFDSVNPFSDAGTDSQAFAAYRTSDRAAVVAFRGTEPQSLLDLLGDVNVLPIRWSTGGRVHAGFGRRALSLLPRIQHWLDTTAKDRDSLLLTGHSLGAALATLAATVLRPARLVTIGSPRVGNPEFAASLDGTDYLRIVDCCDLVTRVPPKTFLHLYKHAGTLDYVTREGVSRGAAAQSFIDRDRELGQNDFFQLKGDKVPARELADHAPINYIRAYFR